MLVRNRFLEEVKADGDVADSGSPVEESSNVVEEEEETSVLDLSDILADNDDDGAPKAVVKPKAEPSEPEGDDEPDPDEAQSEGKKPVEDKEKPSQPEEEVPEKVEPKKPAEPETPRKSFEELRAEEITRVEDMYKFNDEDARAVALEPEKVLPKLAARLYVDIYENVFRSIAQAVPSMMEGYTQQRTARQEAENTFYSEFPSLKGKQNLQSQIENGLAYFRQQNPTATRDQAIAAVGVQVSIANGIPLPQSYLEKMGVQVNKEPAKKKPPPITPANPGAGGSPPVQKSDNYYTRIAEEDIDD